ncbi:MAG: phosphoglycerate dehydrogenase [Planctomycetes bacterium]|nr:phosphoglycerate dehydrogenase [Planctomycetota bacterium]
MKVLVSDPLSAEGIAILKEAGHEVVERAGVPAEELRQLLADCDALIVRSATKATADLLASAERLKVIGRAGAGVDNVDLDAATRRGIVVMNTPGGNTIAACELTMAMMLALARRLPQLSARVKAGEWPKKGATGIELQGKRLGIIGLGRIGAEVARRALAFGMDLVAYDPFVSAERARSLEAQLVPLDELLATSDVITIHAPHAPETDGLLDAAAFAKMKKGVLLINCARGGIIVEAALAEALQSGKVAGCALDVFAHEPPTGSPLLAFDQVIATPHVGATTQEAQATVATQIAKQVVAFLRGGPPQNAVNVPCIEPELLDVLGPYIDLAERLGSLLVQLAEGGIGRLTVTYRGEINQYDLRPLTAALLKGVLQRAVRTVNYVNAPVIAAERGLRVDVIKAGEVEDFANLISADAQVGGRTLSAAGSMLARHTPRIVRVDTYRVDAAPQGHLLVTRNHDRPGVIAHVSSVLARRGINIADMTCGRDHPGGTSLLVISIDNPVTPEIVREIEASPLILRAQLVSL